VVFQNGLVIGWVGWMGWSGVFSWRLQAVRRFRLTLNDDVIEPGNLMGPHSRIPDDVCILKLLYMLKFALRSVSRNGTPLPFMTPHKRLKSVWMDGAVLGNDSTRFVIDDTL
jgi:hypothetical protein